MFHDLRCVQFIPASPASVWEFFATPDNLALLTPPELRFQTLTAPEKLHPGQMIGYRIQLMPGIRVHWLTEITHVQDGRYFVDEQRIGPYKLWHHEHHFVEKAGGVEMTDHVTYALPFAPFSAPIHRWWIKPKLAQIFAYRREKVASVFPSRGR